MAAPECYILAWPCIHWPKLAGFRRKEFTMKKIITAMLEVGMFLGAGVAWLEALLVMFFAAMLGTVAFAFVLAGLKTAFLN